MIRKLVDIGTKKLEVGIHGTGKPVVVIETGMGSSWYDWNEIICEISKSAFWSFKLIQICTQQWHQSLK